jgi:hypothetical protein
MLASLQVAASNAIFSFGQAPLFLEKLYQGAFP